jgi:hypothetical protein
MLTPAQVAAIAVCVNSLRDEWDVYAISAALARVDTKKSAAEVAVAAIKAAADPTNRFPSVISFAGPHWGTRAKSKAPEHWQPPHPCRACNQVHNPGAPCGRKDPEVAVRGAAVARAAMRGEPLPGELSCPECGCPLDEHIGGGCTRCEDCP